jgi:hypothetical protein
MAITAFQPGADLIYTTAAVQQKRAAEKKIAARANNDCGCTDTCNSYVARGIFYGLMISAPLWVVIGGSVFLAYRMME